jgi:hypothetical protein
VRQDREFESDFEAEVKRIDRRSVLPSARHSPGRRSRDATHTPIGFLFLPEPPEECLPIRDLRTVVHGPARPSPDLLDTIYAMQRRQDWLREERLECETGPLEFVGSARLGDDPSAVGQEMRRIVGMDEGWASAASTWDGAVSELRRRIEQLGVMAVVNGVVGNNTHRKLNVAEFRGFALTDAYAPLVFINGADAKSAQMFTLAHELAHVWLGSEGEGVSGFDGIFPRRCAGREVLRPGSGRISCAGSGTQGSLARG